MIQLFLVLHVLGAIAVFGPTFAFPVIAAQASRAPQHGHFAAVIMDLIERRIIIPGAIVQGITGVCLILVIGLDITSPAWRWLFLAIALYATAVGYAILVQKPAAERMVELTAGPPVGRPREPPAVPSAPAGPPPSWSRPRRSSPAAASS